jgi:dTDP-4-amino-4,6-dideoxygalactose transaminase
VHYPLPLHRQPAYQGYPAAPLKVSEELSETVLSLPVHPDLELRHQERVIDAVLQAVRLR